MMSLEPLQKAFDALKELGGYFVIRDEAGEEFIVMHRADMSTAGKSAEKENERQLSLAQAPVITGADEVLERINEELALYQLQQAEQRFLEDIETAAEDSEEDNIEAEDTTQAPPVRIRFEPLRGDLPPDLQD